MPVIFPWRPPPPPPPKPVRYQILVSIKDFIFLVKSILHDLRMRFGKPYFMVLCVMAIILDPLFFYIPVMNDANKCIGLDKILGITTSVLRSVLDFLKLEHIIWVLRAEFGKNGRARLWLLFIIDFLAILPFPQVLAISYRMRGTEFLFAMTFFLLQYLLRVIRTYRLLTKADSTWAIVAFNLLLYMHGGYVFGALWYFLAIEKVTACWKRACKSHGGCSHSSFNCDDSFGHYNFLDEFCPIKTGNTTNYDFGLFQDALQSGIVGVTDFPQKFLHCLRWGLQNLSAFGQNLQASTDVLENIYAICMTNFGVVLFVFLIGKMQSDTERSQKKEEKLQEIKQGPSFDHLSSGLKEQIKKYKQHNWTEKKHADVANFVSNLPKDLGRRVKRELGAKLLMKVKEFQGWDNKEDLYDCLNPVYFPERTRIVREGDPIDEMLFVLEGELWTYSSRNLRTNGQIKKKDHLKYGDFCGEELFAWAHQTDDDPSSDLPISTRTIQALTEVEALSLTAVDLKKKIIKRRDRAIRLIQSYWRFRRILRSKRNERKSQEQTQPEQKKGPEIIVEKP